MNNNVRIKMNMISTSVSLLQWLTRLSNILFTILHNTVSHVTFIADKTLVQQKEQHYRYCHNTVPLISSNTEMSVRVYIFPYSTVCSIANEQNLRVRKGRHQIIFQQIITNLCMGLMCYFDKRAMTDECRAQMKYLAGEGRRISEEVLLQATLSTKNFILRYPVLDLKFRLFCQQDRRLSYLILLLIHQR